MRPSKGTVTGRVWEIADRLSNQNDAVASRKDVIELAINEGVHPSTASTQYYHWKKSLHPRPPRPVEPKLPTNETTIVPDSISKPEANSLDWAWLLKNGFSYDADWCLSEQEELYLDRDAPSESGVYVFVLHDEIAYVGVTTRPLKARMADYRRGHKKQKTSARIRSLILENLKSQNNVRVLFAIPGVTNWNGLPVDIALGLENALIGRLNPTWNRRGTR